MRKTALAPGQLLRSVYMEKSCLGKAGYPPLEVALGQRKTHLNSYRRQTMHLGKVNPGVSELPWGNELSRDHVNRPLASCMETTELQINGKQVNFFTKSGLEQKANETTLQCIPKKYE